jgi:hypothetical protein
VVQARLVVFQRRVAGWLQVGRQLLAAFNPQAAYLQRAGFNPQAALAQQVGFTPQPAREEVRAAVVPPAQGVRLLQAEHQGSPQLAFVGSDASI